MLKVLYLKNNYLSAMNLKKFLTSLFLVLFTFSVNAEEIKIKNQKLVNKCYGLINFSDIGLLIENFLRLEAQE